MPTFEDMDSMIDYLSNKGRLYWVVADAENMVKYVAKNSKSTKKFLQSFIEKGKKRIEEDEQKREDNPFSNG